MLIAQYNHMIKALRRKTASCCRKIKISASRRELDANNPIKADIKCLRISLIEHDYVTISSISYPDEVFGRDSRLVDHAVLAFPVLRLQILLQQLAGGISRQCLNIIH